MCIYYLIKIQIKANGWEEEGSEFEFRWGGENFSPLHDVQTRSGAHPAS
jgi:hypothetical protein